MDFFAGIATLQGPVVRMTLYFPPTIKASIHAFVKSEPIERIEFEKNLLNLGIVNNYEKYIDYNNLLFHVLFSKWINSPVDFGYFVDQNFYGAS